jgi:LmbE family N-acetylglucosaminyl deacetylase
MDKSRREFIGQATTGLGMMGMPAGLQAMTMPQENTKLKIVCIGGHPDDPESGCGGTLARFAAAGHGVTIIYLTRGEAGIPGKSHAESARIRTAEAEAACKILGAKAVFAGQVDGNTVFDNAWVDKVIELVRQESPDIVFTHWPIDSHKDHQCASLLAIQAWARSGKKFALYFFEVCQGSQTQLFHPTDYVDISAFREQKRKAVFCHESQNPPGIYKADDCNHAMMEDFRGIESGVKAAEAFVRCTAPRLPSAE